MTLMHESLELLKMDTGGRVRTSPERREAVLDEFERSGLSGMRFAARYGLKYPTFASWVLRRKKQRGLMEVPSPAIPAGRRKAAAAAKPVRWLEAVAGGAGAGPVCGVVLHLPCGVRMEVVHADHAALAAVLVRALRPDGGTSAMASVTAPLTAQLPQPC